MSKFAFTLLLMWASLSFASAQGAISAHRRSSKSVRAMPPAFVESN
jgi:hypothetical protein